MPPLWGNLGFWLMYVSTQMPSLWDSRGFLGIHSLCLRPGSVRKPNLPGLGEH